MQPPATADTIDIIDATVTALPSPAHAARLRVLLKFILEDARSIELPAGVPLGLATGPPTAESLVGGLLALRDFFVYNCFEPESTHSSRKFHVPRTAAFLALRKHYIGPKAEDARAFALQELRALYTVSGAP